MEFRKRLVRYLVGVAIGLVIVYFFFGDRNCSGWTPGNRVMDEMRHSQLVLTTKSKCQMECLGLTDAAIKSLLLNGKVDFAASRPRNTPRQYLVKSNEITAWFDLADSTATLSDVRFGTSGEECPCP